MGEGGVCGEEGSEGAVNCVEFGLDGWRGQRKSWFAGHFCRYDGGPKMKTQPTAAVGLAAPTGNFPGWCNIVRFACDVTRVEDCSLQVDGRFTGRGREHWHSNPFRGFFLFFADEH